MSKRNPPTMHTDFPMESRVRVSIHYPIDQCPCIGTIVGIASLNIIYSYIILLDEPITIHGETYRAISVPGNQLDYWG